MKLIMYLEIDFAYLYFLFLKNKIIFVIVLKRLICRQTTDKPFFGL